MKKLGLMLLLFTSVMWGAEVTVTNTKTDDGRAGRGTVAFSTSGDFARFQNLTGAYIGTLEIVITGGPASVSIPIQGCARGGTCHAAAATYTATSTGLQAVTFDGPYDVWKITPTWSGGTNVTVTVNIISTVANSHAAGSGSGTVAGLTPGTVPMAATSTSLADSHIVDSANFTVDGSGNVVAKGTVTFGAAGSSGVITLNGSTSGVGTLQCAAVCGTWAASLSGLQGNGAKLQLSTGPTTTNDCVKFDANGNTVDAGAACGGGGSAPTGTGFVHVTSGTQDAAAVPGVTTLYRNATVASSGGDSTEDTLMSYTMPGNTLTANGVVRVTALINLQGSSDTRTVRFYFGTKVFTLESDSNDNYDRIECEIANAGATNTQILSCRTALNISSTVSGRSFNAVIDTAAIDTTASVVIKFTEQSSLNAVVKQALMIVEAAQ